MKINRRPLLAIIPAAALAGSMLTAPVAGAQSSLPTDALGSFTGSLGSSDADPCGEKVVTPSNMGGWFTPDDENEPTFVADENAPLGEGVLALEHNEDGTSLYKTSGAPLSSLLTEDGQVAMNYQFKSSGAAPALQIRILGGNVKGNEGEDNGFATIVWSPAQGDANAWTDAKAPESAEFWVTRPILDAAGETVVLERSERSTLKDIVDKLTAGEGQDATVSEYGVQQTKENKSTGVAVDKFVFGCETTDFEPAPAGPDLGSLALGGGLALAAALAVGGGAFALQNGMIQLPPELAALLPA